MKRILLTTGGTGGHIFPALAVAEQIRRLEPDAELLFVGTEHGPEGRLTSEAGLPFIGLDVQGILGRGIRSVGAVCKLIKGIRKAQGVMRDFNPAVVAGFGSYASFPSLVAAKLSGIPIVIHEQNAVPGLSNRLMGKLSSLIFLSMPDTRRHFESSKTMLTGNPVRQSIARLTEFHASSPESPHLLVMGGSQGAKAINSAVIKALPELSPDIFIHHQTGLNDFERVSKAYAMAGFNPSHVVVEAFIHDIDAVYEHSDLVLCRSGATTIAELALIGKPAIFIPFPYATHDHQTANARSLEAIGAAKCIAESDLDSTDLAGIINTLLHDAPTLEAMGVAARKMASPLASTQIAEGILQLAFSR